MPDGEAIEITLRELYSSNLAPGNQRTAIKTLLRLAVKNVRFNGNEIWYVQSDDLVMGASLALKLTNAWMKSFEA